MTISDWRNDYKKKLCTAEEAARAVKSGDFILSPICLAQTTSHITDAIADRKDELKDVEYRACLTIRPHKITKPEYRGSFKISSGFTGTPYVLNAFPDEGYGQYAPVTVQGSAKQWSTYRLPDVALVMVTPPDNAGFVNIGPDVMYTRTIIEGCNTPMGFVGGARTVIAEVNDQQIPVEGNTRVHISKLTHIVEHSSPMPISPAAVPKDLHRKIAENVVSLLRDRDIIQVGIGAVPNIISDLITESDLKDLGIFTEMLPTGAPAWMEKGILTGKYKTFKPGKLTTSFCGMTKELYDFIRENPLVQFDTAEVVNNPGIIGSEVQMVGINGALEVDLAGQVASLTIGNKMFSGYGGQADWAMGCKISKFGRFIITLGATAKDAQGNLISRIVPNLSQGALVGTMAPYVDYVITEFGIAGPLDGLTIDQRAEELIKIAHPQLQDELVRGAKAKGLFR